MATQMHIDNYGTQHGVSHPLQMVHASLAGGADLIVGIPGGYTLVAGTTGVTDNFDGTITLAAATYVGGVIEFEPTVDVAHEVTDTAGVAIAANTVDQSSL